MNSYKSLLPMALCLMPAFTVAASAPESGLRFVSPAELVDIGDGRYLNMLCEGSGTPTVIFEAGLGDPMATWRMVMPAVAAQTRVCAYDRAGISFSSPSPRPGTSSNAADDLHHLLATANTAPPYLLVGHSLGGMYVRYFAAMHPEEVAGLVLVDPVSEHQGRRFTQLDPQTKVLNDRYVAGIFGNCIPGAVSNFANRPELKRECVGTPNPLESSAYNEAFLANRSRPEYFEAMWSENINVFTTSSDEMSEAPQSLGDLPLLILTRAPFPLGQNETQEMRTAKNQLWVDMHDEMAALSSRGENRVVDGASHYIQIDRPEVVIDAVLEVLATVRNQP